MPKGNRIHGARIPDAEWAAFLRKARENGSTGSAALLWFVREYTNGTINPPPRERPQP